jgi:hypothetical protein
MPETKQSNVWIPNRRLYFTLPEQNFILNLVNAYLGHIDDTNEIALKLKEDFSR